MASMTGAQCRMARAFLRWSLADLAKAADVGISTVQVVEKTDDAPDISEGGIDTTRAWRADSRAESVAKIQAAFEKAGITFLRNDSDLGQGIRGKSR